MKKKDLIEGKILLSHLFFFFLSITNKHSFVHPTGSSYIVYENKTHLYDFYK